MRSILLIGLILILGDKVRAAETLLASWDEAPRVTVVHEVGRNPFSDRLARQAPDFSNPAVTLRYDEPHSSAFSIELKRAEVPADVTLLASIWNAPMTVPAGATFDFWLSSPIESEDRVTGQSRDPGFPPAFGVTLWSTDHGNLSAEASAIETKDNWTHYRTSPQAVPLFLLAATVHLAGALSHGPVLLDAAGFTVSAAPGFLGLTAKPLDQRLLEIASTRSERSHAAYVLGAKTDFSGVYRQYLDQLLAGDDSGFAATNARMRDYYRTEIAHVASGEADLWDLAMAVRLIETYYELGNTRALEPATKDLLLQLLWARTNEENDIGWAGTNTWWLTASENHDLNAKMTCLITSRIFMNEPAYRDRVYPDLGRAPGHGFWFQHMFGSAGGYGPDTPAFWTKSPTPHNAADHYRAWLGFFNRYLMERARRGFFLERASPIYMKWTLDFLYTLHHYCGDEAVGRRTGDLLNWAWADWAQEQVAGIRGGPKTRNQHTVGGYDSMTDMSRFLLGGPGTTIHIYSAMLLDQANALPPVIVDLALDARGKGRYALISRGVGEEEGTFPRPPGTERTLTVDREARFLKYSWVTPDYILGTQMDAPDSVESHLSAVGRWHGLVVTGDPAVRIVPTGGLTPKANREAEADMELMFQTVQDKNVLLMQQARRWQQVSPGWFPALDEYAKPITVYVGNHWDESVEKDGWLFLRHQAAYAAVHVIAPAKGKTVTAVGIEMGGDIPLPGGDYLLQGTDHAWTWNGDKTALQLEDRWSPIIIYAGSRPEHGSFASFQSTVLKSVLKLHATVAVSYYYVTFKAAEPEAKELRFAANAVDTPRIDGQPIDYRPAALFSGPFVQSEYGAGRVVIHKGPRTLNLDFAR